MIFARLKPGMSCKKAMKFMQSYLDGELPEAKAKKVAKHLDKCTACDRESEVYRRIKQSLAQKEYELDPEIVESLKSFTRGLVKN